MNRTHIESHVAEINRCNQRGGRMLSLVDLIDAGSVSLPLAAHLAAAMRANTSLLVGANPGGAGKTAVMCALLNFVPDETALVPVAGQGVLAQAMRDPSPDKTCYIAHEIGAGPYFAYLWGRQARAFFGLATNGHSTACNLHADTLHETYDQLVGQNGVDRAHVQAVALKVYLRMARGPGGSVRRWVHRVYESDGGEDRLIWEGGVEGQFTQVTPGALVSGPDQARYAAFLRDLVQRDVRHIEDVRLALLDAALGLF
ncbi:MAG: hypothetical protein JW934_24170 [Anaerolineae bacterium]|nr:hypothetical protein [Anaerolineae bacterium]